MANLSQEKRKRMLEFLQQIRAEHTDDTSIIAINEIESELTSKKYGLVWEEHTEEVDEQIKHNVPVFTEVPEKAITTDETLPYNFLLEGDNLHSLKLLEKTHKGKIDVIYIDPPYNTGKNDFVYNDSMVGLEDGYRHSKWLSFMGERLTIARALLTDKGVIFLSIDDNEQANLKLLCDSIFGEDNFISMLSVENNPKGRKNSSFISVSNEYCLIYARNKQNAYFIENVPKTSSDLALDANGVYVHNSGKRVLVGENSFNKKVENFSSDKHYSVYFNEKIQDLVVCVDVAINQPNYELIKKGYKRYYSFNKDYFVENTYSKSRFLELYQNGALDFKADKIYEKNFSTTIRLKSMLVNKKYMAIVNNEEVEYQIDVKTTSAGTELKNLFNTAKPIFSNPKNTNYLKLLISLFEDKNITVLDFFAGSGTTAQAVMELNKQDGGNRRFILCTNNENGICENITYQRIKTVITGKRADGTEYGEGISANLKYFKTDYIAKTSEDEEYSVGDKLLGHIAEMVELQHGTKIDNEKLILVLTDEMADGLTEQTLANCEQLYVSVSVLLTTEQEKMFKRMGIEVLTIPDYYFESELLEVGER